VAAHQNRSSLGSAQLLGVSLVKYRGSGGLWDVFQASIPCHHHPLSRIRQRQRPGKGAVIAKLACPNDFPVKVRDSYTRTLLSRDEARYDILHECQVFGGPLRGLWNDVVPVFHGLWGSFQVGGDQEGEVKVEGEEGEVEGGVEVWCAVYEDAGEVMCLGEKRIGAVRYVTPPPPNLFPSFPSRRSRRGGRTMSPSDDVN